MKKIILLISDFLIIGLLIAFVFIYSSIEKTNNYKEKVKNFVTSTVALEHVTEIYMEGEQGICDVWAHYINSQNMTLEEAREFISKSHVRNYTAAHIIYKDNLTGLSTIANSNDSTDYNVSYQDLDILGDMKWISNIGQANNITRAYTNPMNGLLSIAFVNKVKIYEPIADEKKDALILRVIPIIELEKKWSFPQQEFKDAEISMIDAEGNFIIKGDSFKENNFFELYKKYNKSSDSDIENLTNKINKTTDSINMLDSENNKSVLAFKTINTSSGWVFLSFIHEEHLRSDSIDWELILVLTAGLLFLFTMNVVYMNVLNKKLHQMAIEADSANRSKTVFLSTMSHDIRTPMNAIIGLTTLTENNLDDKKLAQENLHKISLASKHLLTLINDILDISKVESGKLALNPLTFSIVDSVENLVNISQPMVKEKNIDFNFRINHFDKEYLYADQLRINQIYINILSNAIKYTDSGGKVDVYMEEAKSEKEGYVKLIYVVSDNGMGMSKEYMERMYQPFSRMTDSRINKIQGTGLGLAITKQMVDLMDGKIYCESEVGKGTTFRIEIDIKVSDNETENLKLDPINVLVVDDDQVLLDTAENTLKSLNVNAFKSTSGSEALELIKTKKDEFDIIIIDWKMPDMDGIETIKAIKKEIGNKVPILLISAYDYSDLEQAAKDAGANGFISKPLFRSTLYKKINEVLGITSDDSEANDTYSDLSGTNVLIAEDNEINWEIIHAMLEMVGVTSSRASNGKICVEMMEKAKDDEYDLIFMDVQMPEMNGLEATRAIRKMNSKKADIPIVALTADAFSENISECINAGMNGHLAKPIDFKLVIKEIRKIKERLR